MLEKKNIWENGGSHSVHMVFTRLQYTHPETHIIQPLSWSTTHLSAYTNKCPLISMTLEQLDGNMKSAQSNGIFGVLSPHSDLIPTHTPPLTLQPVYLKPNQLHLKSVL